MYLNVVGIYLDVQLGPRIAEEGSFEAEYGEKWKILVREFKEKELALKDELNKELEKLQAQMELTRYDYETEMLRQQLRQRELDHERHKMEWENRMTRVPRNFGGPNNSGGGRGNNDVGPMDQGGLDDNLGGGGPNSGGGVYLSSLYFVLIFLLSDHYYYRMSTAALNVLQLYLYEY